MSEHDELVKLLRDYGHSLRAGLGFKHMPKLFNEAADAIEALVEEVERLKMERDDARCEIDHFHNASRRADRAEAERDRLKAALEQLKMHIGPGYEYATLFQIIDTALEAKP